MEPIPKPKRHEIVSQEDRVRWSLTATSLPNEPKSCPNPFPPEELEKLTLGMALPAKPPAAKVLAALVQSVSLVEASFALELEQIEIPANAKKLLQQLEKLVDLAEHATNEEQKAACADLFDELVSACARKKLVQVTDVGYWEADIPNVSFLLQEKCTIEPNSLPYLIASAAEKIRTRLELEGGKTRSMMTPRVLRPAKAKKQLSWAPQDKLRQIAPTKTSAHVDVMHGDFSSIKSALIAQERPKRYAFMLKGLLAGLEQYLQRADLTSKDLVNALQWLQEIGSIESSSAEKSKKKISWPPFETKEAKRAPRVPNEITLSYAKNITTLLISLSKALTSQPDQTAQLIHEIRKCDFESLLLYSIKNENLTLIKSVFHDLPSFIHPLLIKYVKDEKMTRLTTLLYINCSKFIDKPDETGAPPIVYALQGDDEGEVDKKLVKLLIKQGASMLTTLPSGQTVLSDYDKAKNFDEEIFSLLCNRAREEIALLAIGLQASSANTLPLITAKIKAVAEVKHLSAKDVKRLLEEIEDLQKKCTRLSLVIPATQQEELNTAFRLCQLRRKSSHH